MIENELKFVLNDDCEDVFADRAKSCIKIEQKYLLAKNGLSVRIRKSNHDGIRCNYLTFKKNVNGEVVEIETQISEDDCNRLWPTATGKVTKIRYLYEGWEVDFFKYNNKNYMAIAEIEMPPEQKYPTSIPALIEKSIIYRVKRNDRRFSNRKLGNLEYALSLLKSIKNKTIDKKKRK